MNILHFTISALLLAVPLLSPDLCSAPVAVSSSVRATAPNKVSTVVFHTNLHCEKCVKKVVENISYVKGVKDLEVSLKDQTITIKYAVDKTDVKTLKSEINKLGYKAEISE